MYFPYLRGRMYELLALKELAAGGLLSESVIPVVEPLKLTSTFDGMLKAFEAAGRKVAVIYNPEVGELSSDPHALDSLHTKTTFSNAIIPSVLLNQQAEETVGTLSAKSTAADSIIAILNSPDFIKTYSDLFGTISPKFTLAPEGRHFRQNTKPPKVLFEDKFNRKDRNVDYLADTDEFFSDDHLYYKDEGFTGFGDYSIIGDDFNEGGFAPRAVAIHIAHFDDGNALRVMHFVSDSNADISDVAGKFSEAVTKLRSWYLDGNQKQSTMALQTLLKHAEDGTYPGLPTIKKLSIMHHLELIGNYLDGKYAS